MERRPDPVIGILEFRFVPTLNGPPEIKLYLSSYGDPWSLLPQELAYRFPTPDAEPETDI